MALIHLKVKELLAYKRSVDQMCKFLGAKSLFFLSLEGTYKALGYKKETIMHHNLLITVLLGIIQYRF